MARIAVVPIEQTRRPFSFAVLMILQASSSILKYSASILCLLKSSTSIGLNVLKPVCSVTSAKRIPRISERLINSLLKCKPAVGAATAPSCFAYTVWYLSLSSSSGLRLMYLGNGVSPKNSNIFLKPSSSPSHKKRIVRPRLVVLSMTSATSSSFSPKYNLLPTRIFLAGSTMTSHKRLGLFNSLNKNTSIFAPVFSLRPYILAGNTLVLFTTNTSLSS